MSFSISKSFSGNWPFGQLGNFGQLAFRAIVFSGNWVFGQSAFRAIGLSGNWLFGQLAFRAIGIRAIGPIPSLPLFISFRLHFLPILFSGLSIDCFSPFFFLFLTEL